MDFMVMNLYIFFASHIPDWMLEKWAAWKSQQAQTKNEPNQSLLFLAKGLKKRQLSKTENF